LLGRHVRRRSDRRTAGQRTELLASRATPKSSTFQVRRREEQVVRLEIGDAPPGRVRAIDHVAGGCPQAHERSAGERTGASSSPRSAAQALHQRGTASGSSGSAAIEDLDHVLRIDRAGD